MTRSADCPETSDRATEAGLLRTTRLGWLRSLLERHSQLLRYLVVGAGNTVVGYGSFAALNFMLTDRLPYPYMFASAGSSVFAISVAFLGYKFFVFKTKGNYLREYLRTYVVYGTSTVLGLVLLPVLVALVGLVMDENRRIVPYIAQALTIPLVVTASFFGHKRYSFRS